MVNQDKCESKQSLFQPMTISLSLVNQIHISNIWAEDHKWQRIINGRFSLMILYSAITMSTGNLISRKLLCRSRNCTKLEYLLMDFCKLSNSAVHFLLPLGRLPLRKVSVNTKVGLLQYSGVQYYDSSAHCHQYSNHSSSPPLWLPAHTLINVATTS